MAWRRILAFLNHPIPRKVIGGRINPRLLAIARRLYWIQSRVLRIPDRYGFFSYGPPLLRALQAYDLAYHITFSMAIVLLISPISMWMLNSILEPRQRVSGHQMARHLAMCFVWNLVFVYVQEVFFNPMRARDYDWEALHRELGIVQPGAYSLGITPGQLRMADR